ncbi:MAG TPA: LptA/OstA family protein, partial [Spirochaetia bacterium]|nr:LptA/OstA family protein [Spirochaetia bacterium]
MSGKRRRSSPVRAAAALLALLLSAPPLAADVFTYAGDRMTTVLAEGAQHALLTGHAEVATTDMRIDADQIELFGKDFIYAQCRGDVKVVDAKRGLDLSSTQLFYDRQQKIARVQGNAMMQDLKNEMVVKGGFIEDRDKEQLTIIQIGVRILKKDLVCRAEYAKYYRDKKILELSGMPWVSRKGDIFQAARITVNLDTDEITLDSGVQGSIQESTDQGTSPEQNGQQPAGAQPAGAPSSGAQPSGSQPEQPGQPAGSGQTGQDQSSGSSSSQSQKPPQSG